MNEQINLVIVGAGGLAEEIYRYIVADIASGQLSGVTIKGVLDDYPEDFYKKSSIDVPYLGEISDYTPMDNDRLVLAIGSANGRRQLARKLSAQGARFYSYIHPSCLVANNATLGEGVIVCPNSVINAKAIVGDHALINVFCSVGHGAYVGDYSVLSPYAALNGDAKIGDGCFLATRATVFPKISVGNDCIIDTHSYAKSNVPDKNVVSCRIEYVVVKNRLA